MGAIEISIANSSISCDAARLGELSVERFLVKRDAIVAGDEAALGEIEASLLDLCLHSDVLRRLARTALSQGRDVAGGELLRVVKEVMFADAGIEVALQLGMMSSHAPLDARRAAALDSMGTALEQLGS
ncbi:hypothetical protein ACHMW6_06145 [Pseudoduganella sp. UC29_106]|uniref:hypothetical protein n=1 Tax=Pseudoduganella sp. UC29_106 TaxID=3374553 RepID=UPI003756F601